MRHILPLALLLLIGGAGACATTGSGSSGGDRDLLTREQLAEHSDMSAMEVVRRLRPQWLRVRGGQTGFDQPGSASVQDGRGSPAVIQDGQRVGDDVTYLERISASEIEQMRFLDSSAASRRYGTGYTWGAIEITSRRY